MPRLPRMSLSRLMSPIWRAIIERLFERRDRAFGIALVQLDRAQVGECRGFFVASAGLPRRRQECFGMRARRFGGR